MNKNHGIHQSAFLDFPKNASLSGHISNQATSCPSCNCLHIRTHRYHVKGLMTKFVFCPRCQRLFTPEKMGASK